jgi:hypothetical protein
VGVDHRRDGVGGVVEAVHELEAEGDEQREAEQREGTDRQRRLAGGLHVRDQVEERVAEPSHQNEQEEADSSRMHPAVEIRAPWRAGFGRCRTPVLQAERV